MEKKYYAVTRNDELYHHKYIKKKKVNGKWRYYYDVKDAMGYDERAKAIEARRADERVQTELNNYFEYRHTLSEPERSSKDMNRKMDSIHKRKWKTHVQTVKTTEKYLKTPLGKLDLLDDKIDVGRRKVSKFLNKLAKKYKSETLRKVSKKIRPKKELVTKEQKDLVKLYRERGTLDKLK